MLSKSDYNIIEASAKGYYVDDNGNVISPRGTNRKCGVSRSGYKRFNLRINGKNIPIFVHKLCAYKKYGYEAFLCECTRHLDGNKFNNKPDNIALGSNKDNQLDIPKEKRLKRCDSIRKWNKEEIREFYKQTKSYKLTMQRFGISSRGTLWFVLNK